MKLLTACFGVIGASMMFTGCGETAVDINQSVTYEFDGYNGYGNVQYSIDDEVLYGAFASVMDESQLLALELADGFEIDGTWSKEKELSNGDKITFSWNLDKDIINKLKKNYKIDLKYSDINAKVDGLKDISEFDVKDYITVNFSGDSPNGYASASCNIDGMQVELDKTSSLANGDKVVVSLKPILIDDTIEKVCSDNKIPVITSTDVEYTVEGLRNLVESVDQIPEKTMEIMKKKAEAAIAERHSDANECDTFERGDWFISYYDHYDFTDVTYYKTVVRPVEEEWSTNTVYLIYKLTYQDHGPQDTYFIAGFAQIYDSTEGLSEEDIRLTTNLFDTYFLINDDTKCYMRGMEESDVIKFFKDINLNY